MGTSSSRKNDSQKARGRSGLGDVRAGRPGSVFICTRSEIETNWINKNLQLMTIGLKQSFKHCFLTYLAVQKLNSVLHKVILSSNDSYGSIKVDQTF